MRSLLLTVQHNKQRILQYIFAPIDIFIYNEDHYYEHLRIAWSLFCNAVFGAISKLSIFSTLILQVHTVQLLYKNMNVRPSIHLEPLIEDHWRSLLFSPDK